MSRIKLHKIVNWVESNNELIEWQIGVILETQVMYFSIFAILQYLFAHLWGIPVLPDIPDLKISSINMRFEVLYHILFRIGDVI